MKKERLYSLDFVRVISMFMILYYHFAICVNQWTPLKHPLPLRLVNGIGIDEIAVPIFFMISGASLFYNYGNNDFNIKEYYLKRVKGTLPLFWITWLIFFLVYFFFITLSIDGEIPKWTLIFTLLGSDQYFTALTGLKSYALIGEWFLGCILLIYLIFPIIRVFVLRKPKIFGVIMLTTFFLMLTMPIEQIFPVETFNPIFRIIEFTIGIYLIRNIKWISNKIGFLFVFITIIFFFVPLENFGKVANVFYDFSLFVSMIYIWKYLCNKTLIKIVKIISSYSYSVFLNHHVIMYIIFLTYIRKAPMDNGFSSVSNVICLALIVLICISFCSIRLVKLENNIKVFLKK